MVDIHKGEFEGGQHDLSFVLVKDAHRQVDERVPGIVTLWPVPLRPRPLPVCGLIYRRAWSSQIYPTHLAEAEIVHHKAVAPAVRHRVGGAQTRVAELQSRVLFLGNAELQSPALVLADARELQVRWEPLHRATEVVVHDACTMEIEPCVPLLDNGAGNLMPPFSEQSSLSRLAPIGVRPSGNRGQGGRIRRSVARLCRQSGGRREPRPPERGDARHPRGAF